MENRESNEPLWHSAFVRIGGCARPAFAAKNVVIVSCQSTVYLSMCFLSERDDQILFLLLLCENESSLIQTKKNNDILKKCYPTRRYSICWMEKLWWGLFGARVVDRMQFFVDWRAT
jgi:hypothetical protein